jgi:hypothetical protein
MPRLDEIGRHRQAHVAETDECDARHVSLLRLTSMPVPVTDN